ncbi:hypothetical protein DTO166G4_2325 [Paecilomyces variotii]|nr:hypothetical protein DTO166G4_2325 [Paecilomyces variotii]KAJ9240723.1 hypothetical protein DTO166G5_1532 [Paecilomyces variotii]
MMDEIDLLLCLDVEKCAALYRRQKIASLKNKSQESVLPEPTITMDKPRARRRDYENEDMAEKDSLLMPPPRKKARLTCDPVKSNGDIHLPSKADGEKQEEPFSPGNTIDDQPMESHTLLQPSSPTDQTFLISIYDSGFMRFGSFTSPLKSFSDFQIYEDPFDYDIYGSQPDPRWYPDAGEDKENMSEGALEDEEADTEMEDAAETDEVLYSTPGSRMVLRERTTIQEHLLAIQDMEIDEEPVLPEPVLPVVHIAIDALTHLAEQQAHHVGSLA